MVSFLDQRSSASLFTPTETAFWIDNAIDGLQSGADSAQVATMLLHIRKLLQPVEHEPLHMSRVLNIGRRTDRGYRRRNQPNEDASWASQGTLPGTEHSFGLFVVADGMGGHANGQIASRIAIETLVDYLQPRLFFVHQDPSEALLAEGLLAANDAIFEANQQGTFGFEAMGTTMTAALVIDGMVAYIANVGDSRTYLYRRDEGLLQVTVDHSTITLLLLAQAISKDEVATHPKRTEIYRSLGTKKDLEVDTFTVDLRLHDILLLCSDGICGYDNHAPVSDEKITSILKQDYAPGRKAVMLIEAALAAGGPDNCSAIVLEIRNADSTAPDGR